MSEPIRILVVEDDEFVSMVLVESLKECGFDVTAVNDGEEAIALLKGGFEPEIIVTDMVMAKMQGVDVISYARLNHAQVPIIAMSAGGRTKTVDTLTMAELTGADRVFAKPIMIDELEKAVYELTRDKVL